MLDAYQTMAATFGEDFSLTSRDASEAVVLKGMYDRRVVTGEIGGAEVRDSNYVIGVPSADLPAWCGPGCRVDIRSDVLQIVALEPDGQGLTYLVCRVAP